MQSLHAKLSVFFENYAFHLYFFQIPVIFRVFLHLYIQIPSNETFFFVFFCSHFLVLSQVEIVNFSLTDSTLPVLFRGYPNQLSILGIKADTNVRMVCAENEINLDFFSDSLLHCTFVTSSNNIDTLLVFVADSLIYSKIYRVDSLLPLRARFGDSDDTLRSVTQILQHHNL